MLLAMSGMAQQRNKQLTIEVTSLPGDALAGQPLTLTHTGYQVSYGTLKLDADGRCNVKVYAGDHLLELSRDGFEPVSEAFSFAEDEAQKTVHITLTEKSRTPFALESSIVHNPYTGSNAIALAWNKEKPAFFDDFESYSPFSIAFGEWTGIDVDREQSAPLMGEYPNRASLQYAQIMSPMDANPTWWYDQPTLRPYSGRQYVGFTRTYSGRANDDWLISPAITVGTDNVLSFLAKAADIYKERFMVYVTEKLDNPQSEDFTRIDQGTYEGIQNYKTWERFTYDFAPYAGKTVKFAIRYIGHAAVTGAFMLMIDDVYVGSKDGLGRIDAAKAPSRRVAHRSPGNPYESFEIYLDGTKVATVDDYSALIEDVAAGTHTVGVKACYQQTQSSTTEISVDVPSEGFAEVTFDVRSKSVLPAEAASIELVDRATSTVIPMTVADGKVIFRSLPLGSYELGVAEGAFESLVMSYDITGNAEYTIELNDHVITPYNITADHREDGSYLLRWNRDLGFADSFEDYPDFATGAFGDWISIDGDGMPVYPISLGGYVVAFPGSGNASNPQPAAPMVFNPWSTYPPMLPSDPAIAAVTGDKSVIFFSPQRYAANKWLISPAITVRSGFVFTMKAKGYTNQYPESMEICISDGSTNPSDFTVLATIPMLAADQWVLYSVDLDEYADREVRLAVHYTSVDAFLAQVDDVTIGPGEDSAESVDYGNVVNYEVYLDGENAGTTTEPSFTLPAPADGEHTVGIVANYLNARSEMATFRIGTSGVDGVSADTEGCTGYFDIMGRRLKDMPDAGVFISRQGGKFNKIIR